MDSRALYLNTPVTKLFFSVALPGAISMLSASLFGLFDGVFVGHLLGETAFAAVNFAMPIVYINFSLADLIGVGSSVPISISLGRGDTDDANNYFSCACALIFITGILIGAALFAIAPALMRLMGAEGELLRLSVRYLRVYALCSPLTTIVFAMDNYLRICGKIKTGMTLNIIMSLTTLLLEFFCLYFLHMDVVGAALATCLGLFSSVLLALSMFVRGNLQLRFRRPSFSMNLLRQIAASGLPNFLNTVSGRITSILMNVVLLRIGGQDGVTIFGILMYVHEMVLPILYGVCDSLQPAIGYNYGAGQHKRVRQIEYCCLAAGALVSLSAAAAIFFQPELISSFFLKESSPELFDMAAAALRLFSIAFLTKWFGFSIQSYLVALNKAVPASILSLSNAFLLPVALLFALLPFGLNGVWLNTPITCALVAVLSAVMLLREKERS